jgi:ParB-like chromosome segregation protein Spo0J
MLASKTCHSTSIQTDMPTLQISEIRRDGGTQPRAQLDAGVISDYSEAMQRGEDFPPVHVMHDGENYWLYDGFHRVRAAEKLGRTTIDAEVEQGTKEDAQWASLAANKRHGLRRSQADKRRAIKRALKGWGEKKPDREIAEHIGVSRRTVIRHKRDLESSCDNYTRPPEREVTRNGTTYTQDTTNIGGSRSTGDGAPATPTEPTHETTQSRSQSQPDTSTRSRPKSEKHVANTVTPEQAVQRVCRRLNGIAEHGSRLSAELSELAEMADAGGLDEQAASELRRSLDATIKRLLNYAVSFHPNPESEPLYDYDE